ncbi:hypothetical protein AC1031_018838 [Aphanomyces cochlioides]|nr:hypothetical protein AC1031_018838 [Aphanomyces cochlioides]
MNPRNARRYLFVLSRDSALRGPLCQLGYDLVLPHLCNQSDVHNADKSVMDIMDTHQFSVHPLVVMVTAAPCANAFAVDLVHVDSLVRWAVSSWQTWRFIVKTAS